MKRDNRTDVGDVDLRSLLVVRQIRVVDARTPVIRVSMWPNPPPVGVSLGSRQFPEIKTGSQTEWLIPADAETVYFLVEKPANELRGRNWQSGKQQLFGPFQLNSIPAKLKFNPSSDPKREDLGKASEPDTIRRLMLN